MPASKGMLIPTNNHADTIEIARNQSPEHVREMGRQAFPANRLIEHPHLIEQPLKIAMRQQSKRGFHATTSLNTNWRTTPNRNFAGCKRVLLIPTSGWTSPKCVIAGFRHSCLGP